MVPCENRKNERMWSSGKHPRSYQECPFTTSPCLLPEYEVQCKCNPCSGTSNSINLLLRVRNTGQEQCNLFPLLSGVICTVLWPQISPRVPYDGSRIISCPVAVFI